MAQTMTLTGTQSAVARDTGYAMTETDANRLRDMGFTEREAREYAATFSLFRPAGNGTVGEREVQAFYSRFGRKMSLQECGDAIKEMSEGALALTFVSFCQHLKRLKTEFGSDLFGCAHDLLDVDHKGWASSTDVQQTLARLEFSVSREEADDMLHYAKTGTDRRRRSSFF